MSKIHIVGQVFSYLGATSLFRDFTRKYALTRCKNKRMQETTRSRFWFRGSLLRHCDGEATGARRPRVCRCNRVASRRTVITPNTSKYLESATRVPHASGSEFKVFLYVYTRRDRTEQCALFSSAALSLNFHVSFHSSSLRRSIMCTYFISRSESVTRSSKTAERKRIFSISDENKRAATSMLSYVTLRGEKRQR